MCWEKAVKTKRIIQSEGWHRSSSRVVKDQSHNLKKEIILVGIDWVWWQVFLSYRQI